MNFLEFKTAVAKQFAEMGKGMLFRSSVSKDALWDAYLGSFPAGSNPKYRERTEHDCQCCRQFIRTAGDCVAVKDNKLVSIWDVTVQSPEYQAVADALSALVKSKPIADVFMHYEKTVGTDRNLQETLAGVIAFEHFFINLPQAVVQRNDAIPTMLGELRSSHDLLLRGLKEIKREAVDNVLELIAQNSLYRGEENRAAVEAFKSIQECAAKVPAELLDNFAWVASRAYMHSTVRIKNTSIGTLLMDLSEGKDMGYAVKAYEKMVAPANYKRPTALVTKGMIEKAQQTIEQLGLTSALSRRYAQLNDITVNNILFADRSARKAMGDVFSELSASVADKKPALHHVEDVTIDQFIQHILPKAESVEVMLENHHTPNLVSLITAVDPTAAKLFKWDNQFSWSYNGDMADSIKERVKAAGGNVDGDICCRLAWDYSDDLDFHMYEPNGNHIYFGIRRELQPSGGMLDVDANGCDGIMDKPVENIFYQTLSRMPNGTYELKVHNYSRCSAGVGFEVEIEVLGVKHNLVYDKVLGAQKTVAVADIIKNGSDIKIKPHIDSTTAVNDVWGVKTQTWNKVDVVMMSPNHWDDQGVGNRHYFFMLNGCTNGSNARGFFNEFLRNDLNEHRKVLEMVGSKLKTATAAEQLSGVGFSSTQRNKLMCRVNGSFSRVVNILF